MTFNNFVFWIEKISYNAFEGNKTIEVLVAESSCWKELIKWNFITKASSVFLFLFLLNKSSQSTRCINILSFKVRCVVKFLLKKSLREVVEAKEKIKVFTLCIGTKFICIYYVIESIFTITIETITIIYYQNYNGNQFKLINLYYF